MEVFCPDVVHPGDFFNCIIDIPTGNQLSAKIVMKDDLDADQTMETEIKVPGSYHSKYFAGFSNKTF